jgi:dipeptidyl aminopeptidase/acylaminoacyl peptidase
MTARTCVMIESAEPTIAPYGTWTSPLCATRVAAAGLRLGQVTLLAGEVYWLEGRPEEGGRGVVMCRAGDGSVRELTPPSVSVRSRVHEYGGGDFLVEGRTLFFSNDADQRLYRLEPGGAPVAITPEPPAPRAWRYADGCASLDGRIVFCVRERHTDGGSVSNELVAVAADGAAAPRTIIAGRDFYAFPRVSPDGRRLAWTCWDAPNMPWDGTELWVGELDADGSIRDARRVAGGPEESVFQPSWSPDGVLHFISDRTGWWNLYRDERGAALPLAPCDADFGVAQWVFGLSTYAFLADGTIACLYFENGLQRLGLVRPGTGTVARLDLPWTAYSPAQLRSDGTRLAFVAGGLTEAAAVRLLEPHSGRCEAVRRTDELALDPRHIATPEPTEFPTSHGRTAHAFYYAPRNAHFRAPQGERPPLLVLSHGGPTAIASCELSLKVQFWTSRGFAVVDVNYGGSTGFGRGYRERLKGAWGVVDTEDCICAARWLVERGLADGRRLAIRGSSAGGYTTLCALVFHDLFAAGASYYGVADLESLADETHKFEARYLDALIGPYPERRDLYRERSPIQHAERLSCPVILFQGLEDAVVPPAQAQAMVAGLQAKGLPHAQITFAGEQHGFRRAETVRRCLEAELYFYGRVLGFEPADAIEPVEIANVSHGDHGGA